MKDKVTCRDCHFLAKRSGPNGDGEYFHHHWTQKEIRDFKLEYPKEKDGSGHEARCFREVWDEAAHPYDLHAEKLNIRAQLTKNRGAGYCPFFFTRRDEMGFEAAATIQEQDREDERFKKNTRHTRNALWISIAAVLISLISAVAAVTSCAAGS